MIRKIQFVVGFGAGYVLGAKAGTERYAQIEGQARALLRQPVVRRATRTRPSPANPVVENGPADDTASVAGDRVAAVGDVASSGTSGGVPTSPQLPSKSIDEMSELELELATAPMLPSGTAGEPGPAAAREQGSVKPAGRAGKNRPAAR